MDSFYDQPRSAPIQRAPVAAEKILPSHVPDASMLQQNKGNVFHQRAQMSYNAWRVQQKTQTSTNKENNMQKQVRFGSPVVLSAPQIGNMENMGPRRSILSTNRENSARNQYNTTVRNVNTDHLSKQKECDNVLLRGNGRQKDSDLLSRQIDSEFPSRQKDCDFTPKQMDSGFPSRVTDKSENVFLREKQQMNDVLSREDVLSRQKQNDRFLPRRMPSDDLLPRQREAAGSAGNAFCPLKQNNILQSKPFEKIYMANIPNRCLDLSIIEPPRAKPVKPLHYAESTQIEPRTIDVVLKETTNDDSMKQMNFRQNDRLVNDHQIQNQVREVGGKQRVDFNEKQRIEAAAEIPVINDRMKYVMNEPSKQTTNDLQTRTMNDPMKQTSVQPRKATLSESDKQSSDDPSVKDLLQIIQRQNEQLVTLQKQVNVLLEERKEIVRVDSTRNKRCDEVFKNRLLDINGPKNGKFAIDVMTSFEVSIRPPNNFNGRKSHPAKITEITENGVQEAKKATDVSLTLNEPLVVREECPSPENSIHIDMQDFSSSESEEETGSNHSSLIGWTIYNNVMDQVNYLITKSQDDADNSSKPNKFGTATMKKVKEATLRHLKNVGVNLPNMDESDPSQRNDSGLQYSPTEVSFAVKQLLMKYLPSEHLAKIGETEKRPEGKYPTNLIKARPDFSMATVQYMEKYNLLKKSNGPKRDTKMLDITALKQQPKLL